ncbi:hypothetical protein C3941_14465 [Kaistia algarum]|uniref:DUF2125 domain-containing protein n=1 Tax=Kaistia algarum TaxID=2083279 RepID=UPI000CE857C5|nr:DUF2125 domain-containing protein [Kaistia algarum]MCX5514275.1 DUF2125 domain-containing protein [Kaistia algarum]PPE79033.1 hypothetical protein C3941_14465 [Kaistia algarum]
MTAPAAPAPRKKTKRRFQILIGIVIAIVVLWTGGWFAARHYVAGKIAAIEARAADEGATLSCGDQSLSGFPFRLGITCTPVAASCPAEDLSVDLAGIEAMGLLYNPGHALFAAKGPLALKARHGNQVTANWTSLESSVRIGFSGLKRYSLVADGLDAALDAPSRVAGTVTLKADHAELHLVPDPDTAGMIDLFTTVQNGLASVPGRPELPPVTSNVAIGLPESVLKQRDNPVAAWIASGQPIRIYRAEIDVAGLSTALAGDATIDGNGMLSGDFTVRLSALDRLPDLVERFHPGSRERLTRLIGPVSAFLRPVNADGKDWREARITVRAGRATLGFIPLGQIPSLLRGQPVALPGAPAPSSDQVAEVPAPAIQPATPAAEAAPPAADTSPAPAPSGPSANKAALDAVQEIAAAVPRVKRCAVN